MQQTQSTSPIKALGLKILAGAGLILVLLLGAWGVVVIARALPNAFSALSSAAVAITSIFVPAERLEIALDTSMVRADTPFTLSWKHENARDEKGSYTLSYACRDGVSFSAPSLRGTYDKAPCNTPFNFTDSRDSLRLIPTSVRSRFVDVPVTLSFTRLSDGKVTVATETTLTIENPSVSGTNIPGTPGVETPTTPTTPATPTTPGTRTPGTRTNNVYTLTQGGRVSDPAGRVDLAVRIIATGFMDKTTNVFTSSASVLPTQRAGVRFEIENLGTKTAEYWYFNASLPSWPYVVFHSESQPALGPGDKIEYTLGFDSLDYRPTAGVLTVNADPANSIVEPSETNNIAKVTLILATP